MKTDASYMISIDTRDHMNEKCFKCGNVTAYEAGVLILLSIYKVQKDVVIAVFNDRGVQVVNLDKSKFFKYEKRYHRYNFPQIQCLRSDTFFLGLVNSNILGDFNMTPCDSSIEFCFKT